MKIQILHLDDDEEFLQTSREILISMDNRFEVDLALDVDEALSKLSANMYNVIISDYEMAPKNGLDFLNYLRTNNNQTPFILFTGKGREEVAIKALNLGADRYLDKHGNPEVVYKELTINVHQLFEKARDKQLLQESEERYAMIVENIQDAISLTDATGIFTYVSPSLERIYGYQTGELLGKNAFELMHPEDVATVIQPILTALQQGKEIPTFVVRGRTKNGVYLWLENSAKIIKDTNGEIKVIVVSRNIEERKKIEAKLEAFNEKLRFVSKLTKHDVGNKLANIVATTFILKKKLPDKPKLIKQLENIESAVAASNKIFEFSQLYEKIGVEAQTDIDVGQCFNEAGSLVQNLGNVAVINESQGLVVSADSLLKQIFYNLIDNSLKHGKNVTLIKLYQLQENDKIKLYYEDNGVGIPNENKTEIFKEGFSTTDGTGLGLAIIKKIIEVYHWAICEIGTPGKGAKFEIIIPISKTSYPKQCKLS